MTFTEVILGLAGLLIAVVGGVILLPRLWEVVTSDGEAFSTRPKNNPGYIEQPTGPIVRSAPEDHRGQPLVSPSTDWTPLHRPGRAR